MEVRVTVPELTPVQVVIAAFAAAKRRDWSTVAKWTDPDVLPRHQREQIARIALPDLRGRFNSKSFVRDLEGLETDVMAVVQHGEAELDSYDFALKVDDLILKLVGHVPVPAFPNSPTLRELADLPALDFFLRWCDASYRAHEGLSDEPLPWEGTLLGQIFEGQDWAYVLCREPKDTHGRPSVRVYTLRRADDRWLLCNPPTLACRSMVASLSGLYR